MQFVSVRDLRSKSSELWKKIRQQIDLVVTSNGRPIAILSGVSEDNLEESLSALRQSRAIQAVESMQLSAKKAGLDRLTAAEIDQEIEVVRKARRK